MTDLSSNQVSSLFLTLKTPYPPMGGTALRNWQIINTMMQFGSVDVVAIVYEGSQKNITAACPPGVQVYKQFHTQTIYQKRTLWQKVQNKLWWLNPLTHPKFYWLYGDIVIQELVNLISSRKPNIIFFADVRFYHYFSIIKKYIKYELYSIYLSQNVEGDLSNAIFLSTHTKGQKKLFKSSAIELLPQRTKLIENKFVNRADQVWVCSDDDARLMQKLYGQQNRIKIIPNGINIDDYESIRLGTCPLPENWTFVAHTLVFPATFGYKPNAIAAQILIEQIYPKLQKIYPDCRLLLVGYEPTKQMKEAARNDPGIIVTGKVPDVRPYLAAASVVVVPLLEGGGTRLKILEAFAAGRPVVSTSKGAEGIKAQDGKHLLIRDEIEDIVAGIGQLWSNPSLGQRLTDASYELVKAEYSWESIHLKVQKILEKF
ncbi:MAG: glycosyltransferase family 4 protein [Xenococcaceae cyanobacterium]